jgi:hypothetical protein
MSRVALSNRSLEIECVESLLYSYCTYFEAYSRKLPD